MKTPEEIKRDMAKCAKRAKKVIMYSCDVGEMAEYTETVSNTLIVGRYLLQQLEQDNAQKDERIRRLERERDGLLKESKHGGGCFTCKHKNTPMGGPPCSACWWFDCWEWRGVEEDDE